MNMCVHLYIYVCICICVFGYIGAGGRVREQCGAHNLKSKQGLLPKLFWDWVAKRLGNLLGS